MFKSLGRSLQKLFLRMRLEDGREKVPFSIVRKGSAMRVIFFYPGEEGTYLDNAEVTLYENGVVHIQSNQEETTTHLQNCEILWRFEVDSDDRASKLRLLKPKTETRVTEEEPVHADAKPEVQPGAGATPQNPE
jgi:hypothetical protein